MIFLLIASLFSSTLLGYLVATLFLPRYTPRWAESILKVSLGVGIGCGLTSCLYFLVRLIAGPSMAAYIPAELLLLISAGMACWRTRVRGAISVSGASGSGQKTAGWLWLLPIAFVAALCIAITLFVDSSVSNPYGGWDAWAIWNLRAKFLAQPDASWRTAFAPVLNRLAGLGATHPDYPLLLSGYVARCWSLTHSIGDVAVPVATSALFSFGTLALLVSALAILRGWSAAMLGGLILLGTAGFLLDSPWQYSDLPLGFYFLAAFVLFFLADAETSGVPLVLQGLAIGFAAWTKNEGLLFALLAGIGFLAYLWLSKRTEWLKPLALLAVGAALPLGVALYFKFFLAPPTGTYAHVTLSDAAHRAIQTPRYSEILKSFWDETVALGSGIAHPAISLALLAGFMGIPRDRRRQPVVIASTATLLAVFAGYFFTYVVTPLELTWHLGTSMGRLYMQLWPSVVFLSLAAFRTAEETAIVIQHPQKAGRAARKKTKKAQVN